MSLDAARMSAWVARCADLMTEHHAELTELDTAIGDGDHGDNLVRGFRAATEQITERAEVGKAPQSASEVLQLLGASLLSHVGGASGPLLGTAILAAAKSLEAPVEGETPSQTFARMLESGSADLARRGRAELRDKTMLDAWEPAACAAREAADASAPLPEAIEAATTAAAEGAERTKPLRAVRGRASYLGERSRGHVDPGARSAVLILQAGLDVVGN